ncbi:MAG: hypothetical protein JHC68_00725 [Polynucleobacter sp.]|jgi:hypothetical protein|nr:hypothetical protein [Polynucleobacter sp.]
MNPDNKNPTNKLAKDCLDWLRGQNGPSGIMARSAELLKVKNALNLSLNTLNLGHFSDRIEPSWRTSPPEELLLIVPNATLAARLEQVLPSLASKLAEHGYRGIQLKVRLVPSQRRPSGSNLTLAQNRRPAKGLNAVARSAWLNLLSRLPPESKLRHTITRLLAIKPK